MNYKERLIATFSAKLVGIMAISTANDEEKAIKEAFAIAMQGVITTIEEEPLTAEEQLQFLLESVEKDVDDSSELVDCVPPSI